VDISIIVWLLPLMVGGGLLFSALICKPRSISKKHCFHSQIEALIGEAG
jgi:hypothetical protein